MTKIDRQQAHDVIRFLSEDWEWDSCNRGECEHANADECEQAALDRWAKDPTGIRNLKNDVDLLESAIAQLRVRIAKPTDNDKAVDQLKNEVLKLADEMRTMFRLQEAKIQQLEQRMLEVE